MVWKDCVEIFRNEQFLSYKLCGILNTMMTSLAVLYSAWDRNHFYPDYSHCISYLPISRHFSYQSISSVLKPKCSNHLYIPKTKKQKSNNSSNSDMIGRSPKTLPWSKKRKDHGIFWRERPHSFNAYYSIVLQQLYFIVSYCCDILPCLTTN